jgi:hypothetical protein
MFIISKGIFSMITVTAGQINTGVLYLADIRIPGELCEELDIDTGNIFTDKDIIRVYHE